MDNIMDSNAGNTREGRSDSSYTVWLENAGLGDRCPMVTPRQDSGFFDTVEACTEMGEDTVEGEKEAEADPGKKREDGEMKNSKDLFDGTFNTGCVCQAGDQLSQLPARGNLGHLSQLPSRGGLGDLSHLPTCSSSGQVSKTAGCSGVSTRRGDGRPKPRASPLSWPPSGNQGSPNAGPKYTHLVDKDRTTSTGAYHRRGKEATPLAVHSHGGGVRERANQQPARDSGIPGAAAAQSHAQAKSCLVTLSNAAVWPPPPPPYSTCREGIKPGGGDYAANVQPGDRGLDELRCQVAWLGHMTRLLGLAVLALFVAVLFVWCQCACPRCPEMATGGRGKIDAIAGSQGLVVGGLWGVGQSSPIPHMAGVTKSLAQLHVTDTKRQSSTMHAPDVPLQANKDTPLYTNKDTPLHANKDTTFPKSTEGTGLFSRFGFGSNSESVSDAPGRLSDDENSKTDNESKTRLETGGAQEGDAAVFGFGSNSDSGSEATHPSSGFAIRSDENMQSKSAPTNKEGELSAHAQGSSAQWSWSDAVPFARVKRSGRRRNTSRKNKDINNEKKRERRRTRKRKRACERYKKFNCNAFFKNETGTSEPVIQSELYEGDFNQLYDASHRFKEECLHEKRWPHNPKVCRDMYMTVHKSNAALGCFKPSNATQHLNAKSRLTEFIPKRGEFRVKKSGLYVVQAVLNTEDRSKRHWAAIFVDHHAVLACPEGGFRSSRNPEAKTHHRVCRMGGLLQLKTSSVLQVKTMAPKMEISLNSQKMPTVRFVRISA